MLPVVAAFSAGAGLLLAPEADTLPDRQRDLEVPLAGITRESWVKFVGAMVNGKADHVTPTYRLGAFELSVRRLCDLGVMTNLRGTGLESGKVWDADWIPPGNLKTFLADPFHQYDLFSESMRRYSADPAVTAFVGALVDDTTTTLSGVLAVAHRAGLPGLSSWVVTPKERTRFSNNTTAFYSKANGLF
jgi:hypothetical protein